MPLTEHCRNNSKYEIISVVPFSYVPVIASEREGSKGAGAPIGRRIYPNHFAGKHVVEQLSAMPVRALGVCLSVAFSSSDKLQDVATSLR